jgi:hypothetical protein
MQVKPEIIALVVIALWLIGLTGFFYWFYQGINRLYKKTKKRGEIIVFLYL